ncbi:cobalt-precorrin-5B (C(1))-methyltransferase, partial [uncultured Anaerotruncus sp.]|uniref:cobalt-precorrin-5B (C(1))-methyltransferase n=1 Tax=uncultured Anaerotruncus sp. TaxID=905011 RepID=UPI00280B295B
MGLDRYVLSGGKRLRCGYTTGSCAAAAAKAAALALLTGEAPARVEIGTPEGVRLDLPVEGCVLGQGVARCAVRKDAGDDIDATDGALVCAEVRLGGEEITVDGGEG